MKLAASFRPRVAAFEVPGDTARQMHLEPRLIEISRKELGLRKRQVESLRDNAAQIVAAAGGSSCATESWRPTGAYCADCCRGLARAWRSGPRCRAYSSQLHVLRIVPPSNHRFKSSVIIAEDAQAGCVQQKMPGRGRFQPKPADSEDAQQV